jgi:hypothetical protein
MAEKPWFRLDEILGFLAKHGYTCTQLIITPTDNEWTSEGEAVASFTYNRHQFLKNGKIPDHDIKVIACRSVRKDEEWELCAVEEVASAG